MQGVSLEAKQNIFCQNVLLNRDNKPYQTTPGSSGLDLSSTTSIILTPDVPVTQIPMRVASPLPEDIVRLVLGHSLLSFQEISVVSCVVNSDYTEKIEVLISPPAKTVQLIIIKKIAQLLLLPYYQTEKPDKKSPRGSRSSFLGAKNCSFQAFKRFFNSKI